MQEKPSYTGLAFTKHSPLTPVFALGWSSFRENGHLDQMAK
jgi:hypothetical protein